MSEWSKEIDLSSIAEMRVGSNPTQGTNPEPDGGVRFVGELVSIPAGLRGVRKAVSSNWLGRGPLKPAIRVRIPMMPFLL